MRGAEVAGGLGGPAGVGGHGRPRRASRWRRSSPCWAAGAGRATAARLRQRLLAPRGGLAAARRGVPLDL